KIENNHRDGDYVAYSLTAAAPDYLRRGVNGEIYSIHAPGLAVLIAPAMWFGWACCALTAPFFFQSTEVFPDGVAATCLLLGTMPLWDGLKARPLLIDEDGSGRPSGRLGDGQALSWILSGASLAILPWLQTRLAVLALAAALCVLLR